jgi:deferrochelatase/peroxidase EfeB
MAAAAPAQVTEAPSSDKTQDRHDFHGVHQTGIVTPRPAVGHAGLLRRVGQDREDLERLFRTLNERIAFLMKGGPVPQIDPKLPPPDSGILGPVVTPDNLTITVSVGDSLFDERFGLARRKPKRLIAWSVSPTMRWKPTAATAT